MARRTSPSSQVSVSHTLGTRLSLDAIKRRVQTINRFGIEENDKSTMKPALFKVMTIDAKTEAEVHLFMNENNFYKSFVVSRLLF